MAAGYASYPARMPRAHRIALVVLALLTVALFMSFVRVRRPSPFATGGGYGVGHGAMGLMFGASPRPGVAR